MSVYSIGVSGLTAAQTGMQTTGHNIANVNTPGFSRQRVEQASAAFQSSEVGGIGKGTTVAAIRRLYSDSLTAQVRDIDSQLATSRTLSNEMDRLTALLGDEQSGLSVNLADFFAAVQAVATNPSDLSTRATLVGATDTLIERMHSTDVELRRMRTDVNLSITDAASNANSFASEIADLNARIAVLGASGQSPNDLLDQRDHALRELAKVVKINSSAQDDGQLNVFLGTGQAIVVAGSAFELKAQVDPAAPGDMRLVLTNTAKVDVPVEQRGLGSGSLAGLIDMRDRMITGVQNGLGRLAAVLANQVNAQHQLGINRNGAPGGLFFAPPSAPGVAPGTKNDPASGTLAATITDYTQLRATDYTVRYSGSGYSVVRMSDGAVQTFSTLPQTIDGSVQIELSGSLAAGDTFLVQPTRVQLGSIARAVRDPAEIAAASPVVSAAALTNLGTATISSPAVTGNAAFAGISHALQFSVSGGVTTYSLVDTTTNTTVSSGNAYTSGATISHGGWQVKVSGVPKNGDTFTVVPNTSGTADGRNARALVGLQKAEVVQGATLGGAYGQVVGTAAIAARDAGLRVTSLSAALTGAEQVQSSVSGVNLDEEAANLLRYQQAYQASAKFIQIASSLFDDLLSLAR